MKTYRTSLLSKVSKCNFIHFMESVEDFKDLIKFCIERKIKITNVLRLPDDDEVDGMFYVCSPSCYFDISPFRIVFTDILRRVTINVLIDRKGNIKGWF